MGITMHHAFNLFAFAVGTILFIQPVAASEDSQFLVNKGIVEMDGGNYDGALKVFSDALKTDAEDEDARYYRGQVLNLMGRYGDALAEFALVGSDAWDTSFERGFAMFNLDDFAGSLIPLEEASKIEGEAGNHAKYYLALSHYRLSNLEKAVPLFRDLLKSLKDVPEDVRPSLLLYAGIIRTEQKETDRANKIFTKLVTDYPDTQEAGIAQQFLDEAAGGESLGIAEEKKEKEKEKPKGPKALTLTISLLPQYDTNPTLLQEKPDTVLKLRGADKATLEGGAFRVALNLGAEFKPYSSKEVQSGLGVGVYQSTHISGPQGIGQFNIFNVSPYGYLRLAQGAAYEMLGVRVSHVRTGPYDNGEVNFPGYSNTWAVKPGGGYLITEGHLAKGSIDIGSDSFLTGDAARNAFFVEPRVGYEWTYLKEMNGKVGGEIVIKRNSAELGQYSYLGYGPELEAGIAPVKGLDFAFTLGLSKKGYDDKEADPVTGMFELREDTEYSVGLDMNVRLEELAGLGLPLGLRLGVNYLSNDSTGSAYTYTRTIGTAGLSIGL